MSYYEYLNSPSYIVPTGTVVPINVQDFYNSVEFQAYLDNDPTTTYTITNLYTANNAVAYYGQTIPILSGVQYVQLLQAADGTTLSQLIPAGTYNVSFNATIVCANDADDYLHTAQLLLYNTALPTATQGLAVSSSGNYYNNVADANVFITLKGYQRIILTADTTVSMYLRTIGNSEVCYAYYGNSSNNVSMSASFTFTPTI